MNASVQREFFLKVTWIHINNSPGKHTHVEREPWIAIPTDYFIYVLICRIRRAFVLETICITSRERDLTKVSPSSDICHSDMITQEPWWLLSEEDKYGLYSNLLFKYFLAEGIVCGHELFVASAKEHPDNILKELGQLWIRSYRKDPSRLQWTPNQTLIVPVMRKLHKGKSLINSAKNAEV